MREIQMVDLKGQYLHIKDEIDAAIQQVISSTHFVKGETVAAFEEHLASYAGSKFAISCGNGTDALQISLMALGLQAGDEVITTPFTFVASAEVIALLGLKPVFADTRPDTFNIDVTKIEAVITPKTKAIIPVHLFGQCADMEAILSIARKHHLYVVEDACQSIGTEVTFSDGTVHQAGTMGNIGCLSFFPSKNLGCYGDGGAIFTQDEVLAKKIRAIANHGMIERYHYETVGVNSRLDAMQAAILDVKLKHLPEYLEARRKAAAYYDKAFAQNGEIATPATASFTTHTYHQYTLRVKAALRSPLIDKLKAASIPAMIYYPIPLHLQKAYLYLGYKAGDFPIAEALSESVLSLPMHTELDEEQLRAIVGEVKSVVN